ncbi:MAG: sulfotransferase family protein [Methylacidiphilales bacterium]|nr:sulfotransferase family protein [Candidatus Methylacidiphilales bacterium]
MALLLKNNAVFLHVPKTGGTWVAELLKHLGLVKTPVGGSRTDFERLFWYDRFHRDEKVFRNLIRRRLGWLPHINPGCFKFCFVREPLSWYVSWWRFMECRKWRSQGDEKNPYHKSPVEMLNGLGSHDFNTFVDNVNRKRPGFVTEMYGWYARPSVAFVGKQENLRRDLLEALSLMRMKTDVAEIETFPEMNVSPPTIHCPEWDPKLKQKTYRLEYAAYVRYGYAMPEPDAASTDSIRPSRKAQMPANPSSHPRQLPLIAEMQR